MAGKPCVDCGGSVEWHRSRRCWQCYVAGKGNTEDDAARLRGVTDTHQRCRGCGAGMYAVSDWLAEANRKDRKWFCSRDCFRAWLGEPARSISNG